MQQDTTADRQVESWAVLSLIAVVLGRNKIERLIGKFEEFRRIAIQVERDISGHHSTSSDIHLPKS